MRRLGLVKALYIYIRVRRLFGDYKDIGCKRCGRNEKAEGKGDFIGRLEALVNLCCASMLHSCMHSFIRSGVPISEVLKRKILLGVKCNDFTNDFTNDCHQNESADMMVM